MSKYYYFISRFYSRLKKAAKLYKNIQRYHFIEDVEDDETLEKTLSSEYDVAVKRSFSLSKVKEFITDTRRSKLFKTLDSFYYKKSYDQYISILNANINVIIQLRKTKYLSWAALITKGDDLSRLYLGKAVDLHPLAINDITTALIIESYPDKSKINKYLKRIALSSSNVTPLAFSYVIYKFGEANYLNRLMQKEYFISKLDLLERIELHHVLNQFDELIGIHEKYLNYSSYDAKTFEQVYDAYTRLGMLEKAEQLFSIADRVVGKQKKAISKKINPHVINNKLERHFWFMKGDLVKAYSTYRRQNLAQVLSLTFPDKYTQNTSRFVKSNQPLVLASWGPGDEIRFSRVYEILARKNMNLTVSCEPRLFDILSALYPSVKFLPVNRTRRVSQQDTYLYSDLPHPKLHHLMDNNLYHSIDSYDSISLLTDLLAEQIDEYSTGYRKDKIPLASIENIDLENQVKDLKDSGHQLIGISWRSSIQTTSRNEHYFTIEQLLPILKLEDVTLVNLQYGDCSCEFQALNEKHGIHVHHVNIDHFNDFYSVINLMQSLDVIVSAGTTVLELAGLSGTKTYALTNHHAMQYRVRDENRDLWFNNIQYIPDMTEKTKPEIINYIAYDINKPNEN